MDALCVPRFDSGDGTRVTFKPPVMTTSPHRSHLSRSLAALSVLMFAPACDTGLEDRVLRVEATGAVTGFIYRDLNGDSLFSDADGRVQGLVIHIGYPGLEGWIAADTTRDFGEIAISGVPVGRMEVRLDPTFLADSLRIIEPDSMRFTLTASGDLTLRIGLAYPGFSIVEARTRPNGSPLFISGSVLSPRFPTANGTIFIRGSGGSIRVTSVPPGLGLTPGDSVRVRGHLSTNPGSTFVESVGVFRLSGSGSLPVPTPVSTAVAARAGYGVLDADLVQIANAVVLDTATVAGDRVATISDGSGELQLRLQGGMDFTFPVLIPGISVLTQVRGVLLPQNPDPDGSLRWALLPRAPSDLTVSQTGGVGHPER